MGEDTPMCTSPPTTDPDSWSITLGDGVPSGVRTVPSNMNSRYRGHPNYVSTTKFTPLTWLPKSLFYQFQRIANIYFLYIASIVIAGSFRGHTPFDYSTKSWHSKVFPFIGVLLWTALKDLVEDFRRGRDDRKENMRKTLRYDGSKSFVEVAWSEVLAGDLLRVPCDGAFAADLLLLRASGNGQAFISTANLDGETSLKERLGPHIFGELVAAVGGADEAEEAARRICEMGLEVKAALPSAALTDVSVTCKLGAMGCPASEVSFLPRGCVLRNTPWVLALAVYVGDDTKTRLNMTAATTKTSNMQKFLNGMVWGLLVVLCIFCIYCASRATGMNTNPQYLNCCNDFVYWVVMFFRFNITFYHVVPISLYVCFEMLKLVLGYLVNQDPTMFYPSQADPGVKEGAFARTADLIEELGQVDFLFSDKTGTLTANEMIFAKCYFGGTDYGDFRQSAGAPGTEVVKRHIASDARIAEEAASFFTLLSLCHGCQVDKGEEGKYRYSAMSPDDVALVQAASDVGFVFESRNRTPGAGSFDLSVKGPRGRQSYTVLHELEFNSERKRMSVIVRWDGEIWCLTKGADSVIMNLLETAVSDDVRGKLSEFSKQGLRTLLFARKKVDETYYAAWAPRFVAANGVLDKTKDADIARVAAEMETELTFVGVTAVEDRLQEGVPEAIATLKDAGIRVWVLTGDKIETAVDIARSSRLFNDDTTLAYATLAQSQAETLQLLEDAKAKLAKSSDPGLVLDGATVGYALESPEMRQLIYDLGLSSRSCICCRLSPMQKRRLVELVRQANPATITLAIGDGANDVPMIDGAHVGIGIRGKEGNQAVQVSDVAISQFRFLVPLLLNHGRRAYRRVAFFLLFFLYKNIALAMADVVWVHQSGFAKSIAFPEYLSMGYNVVFTSVHVIVCLAFDADVPDDVSVAHPSLYRVGPTRALFNIWLFIEWVLFALWHGTAMWLVPYRIINETFGDTEYDQDDSSLDFWLASACAFFILCLIVNLRLLLLSQSLFKYSTWVSVLVALLFYVVYGWGLGYTSLGWSVQENMKDVPLKIFMTGDTWAAILLASSIALFPDCVLRLVRWVVAPSPLEVVRKKHGGVGCCGPPCSATRLSFVVPAVQEGAS